MGVIMDDQTTKDNQENLKNEKLLTVLDGGAKKRGRPPKPKDPQEQEAEEAKQEKQERRRKKQWIVTSSLARALIVPDYTLKAMPNVPDAFLEFINLNPFKSHITEKPYYIQLYQSDAASDVIILGITKEPDGERTAVIMTQESVEKDLSKWLTTFNSTDFIFQMEEKTKAEILNRERYAILDDYGKLSPTQITNVVKAACNNAQIVNHLYPPTGWADTKGIVMYRLPFPRRHDLPEIAFADNDENNLFLFQQCPTFFEMIARMSNAKWFLWRIGSMFDPNADRKQVGYIYGPADCGKSQISDWLMRLCGPSAATMTVTDFKQAWWKSDLLGKRVVTVSEAASGFLNTCEFKSITGDSLHKINEKFKKAYKARITCLFWFFSNDAPEIKSEDALFKRVCPILMAPPGGPLISDEAYQAKLWAETQAFLSLCIKYYEQFQGHRHDFDQTETDEASENKEEWALNILHTAFDLDPSSWILANEAQIQIKVACQLLGQPSLTCPQQGEFWRIAGRRFNIKKIQKKEQGENLKRVYGIRKKPLHDPSKTYHPSCPGGIRAD